MDQDIQAYKDRILIEVFNSGIVEAIAYSESKKRGIGLETHIWKDVAGQAYLTLSKVKADKLIEMYEFDLKGSQKMKYMTNYIGSIIKTVGYGRSREDDHKSSVANRLIYASSLKNGTSLNYGDSNCEDLFDNLPTDCDSISTSEMWNELKELLHPIEQDYLEFYINLPNGYKQKSLRAKAAEIRTKLRCLVAGKEVINHNPTKYLLTDEQKQMILEKRRITFRS